MIETNCEEGRSTSCKHVKPSGTVLTTSKSASKIRVYRKKKTQKKEKKRKKKKVIYFYFNRMIGFRARE